jgi:hypothetical protein
MIAIIILLCLFEGGCFAEGNVDVHEARHGWSFASFFT